MSIQRQVLIWTCVFIVFVFSMWLLSGILLPFVAGMAVAYFLDPLADRLEEGGLSRLVATSIITITFLLVLVVVSILVLPLLYQQTVAFIEYLPNLVRNIRSLVADATDSKLARVLGARSGDVDKAITGVVGDGMSWAMAVISAVGAGGLHIVSVISLIIVTPVVAFYLLLDWDRLVRKVDDLVPREHLETARQLGREINTVLAGFVRGQVIVCIFLGVFYSAGLSLVGLKFGLVVGIVTGVLSFIPYLGSIIGFVASFALAWFQFGPDFVQIGLVAGIFFLGQFIEGNFLSPKLVGDKVGLHPVWVMFAIFAFSALGGFVGALVAVPVAATLGVLTRYTIRRYEQSKLYLGDGDDKLLPPSAG
jgi:predicted PurR-regulated permease PerM